MSPAATEFTIATDRIGPRRWFQVRIYPTIGDLQAAAHRYRPGTVQAASGVCHPATHPWPANGFAGIIRLTDEAMWDEIAAHEIVHAACAIYRENVARDIRLGTGWRNLDREEDLAFIYGELHDDFIRKYRRHLR